MLRGITMAVSLTGAAMLIAGCTAPTEEEQAAASVASEARAAEKESQNQKKQQQKADREAEKQRKEEEKEAKKRAEEDAKENAGTYLEEWWLSRYDAASWQDIGDQYPGG